MTTTRKSNFSAALRTTILMATLGGLLVAIGYAIGGIQIASVFLVIALVMNFVAFFFSDKIAIASARAKPLSEQEAPGIYQMVRELTTRAGLPMPRLYMIPSDQPNAFATGRSPKHSAVAVTSGITKLLSEDELRGVIAHELAHISNRDILTQSVASAIGAMITYLAYFFMWFGGDDESPLGLIGSLALVHPGADRGDADPARGLAPARVLGRRDRGRVLRQPGVARLGAAAARGGRQGDADAGQPGDRAALHRQAVQGRRDRGPVLDPPADRGARAPAAPDAPADRLATRNASSTRSSSSPGSARSTCAPWWRR